MVSEAQRRAVRKYSKEYVKQIRIEFYPDDHELFDAIKDKGKKYGSIQGYIKDVLRKDLGIEKKDSNEKNKDSNTETDGE